MTEIKRPLRVFLCHASGDKPVVKKLYERLVKDGFDAWLDKEKLIPGQNWQFEIPKAVKNSDVVIVCISTQSVTKEGFVQKEIKFALDVADEKPEDTIFIIPARLEECDLPERISKYQWVDLFSDDGYRWLIKALQIRASHVGATNTYKENVKTQLNEITPNQIPHKKESEIKPTPSLLSIIGIGLIVIIIWAGIYFATDVFNTLDRYKEPQPWIILISGVSFFVGKSLLTRNRTLGIILMTVLVLFVLMDLVLIIDTLFL